MVPFWYKPVDQSLIRELVEKIQIGDSCVLLGARYGGKRYVMARVREALEAEGSTRVVRLNLLREVAAATAEEARRVVLEAVEEAYGSSIAVGFSEGDLFAPVQWLSEQVGMPVILIAANVDGMAHHLARLFLEQVRALVQAKKLTVLLSGEDDFRDLVHGPKSEFNCAHRFVLQGFASDEFRAFLSRYAEAVNIKFDNDREAFSRIFELTGGSIFLARALLWSIVERLTRVGDIADTTVSVSQIPHSLASVGIPDAFGAHILRHAVQIIDREPESWEVLRALLDKSSYPVGDEHNAPSPLELAGMAVRNDAELCFSSPLMADFAKRYYDDRRFGDLYAKNGDWVQAFSRYAQVEPRERCMRPCGIDDRSEVQLVVKSLSSALHLGATRGTKLVADLFSGGCRYVLGFPNVVFCDYKQGSWIPAASAKPAVKRAIEDLTQLIPPADDLSPGHLPLPEDWSVCAVAAILAGARPDQRSLVIVGDLEKKAAISREREQLLVELLARLVEAYGHANAFEILKRRLTTRNTHVDIMNTIFQGLGMRVKDVGQTLAMAARGLRELGYRRVLFCLVAPREETIVGILDNSDDPSVDVAAETNYRLDDPKSDLQPYVVHTRKPIIVEAASREPLANQDVVRKARMNSVAIVPLVGPGGHVVGTVHVEREDEAVPSQDEVDDLVRFGRQLAIAIEQSERVNLLQTALDRVPEPVMIVDRLERLRYANEPARRLFGVPARWSARHDSKPLSKDGTDDVLVCLRESLDSGRRVLRNLLGVGNDPGLKCSVITDGIQNWRDDIVGALVHIQDLRYLHRVFDAMSAVGEATDTESAARAMLEAAKALGHKWGRLYLLEGDGHGKLVSKLSFGYRNRRHRERFDGGRIALPAHGVPGSETWMCIDKREPLVFCWKDELKDGQVYSTPHGLKAINVIDPKCPKALHKKPGDFWIDFPLLTRSGAIGKVTLQCDEDVWPEHFELLKTLSEITADLLDAFRRRDEAVQERETCLREEVGEQAVAIAAHNIATRLAGLPVLLKRYTKKEMACPDIAPLNKDFRHAIREMLDQVQRIKQLLVKPVLQLSQLDIRTAIAATLANALSDGKWQVQIPQDAEIEGDSHLLEMALLELVQNSRDAVEDSGTLHVTVAVKAALHSDRQCLVITYKDKGPGVPAEFKQRVFEDFFSRRPGRKTGLGLGLAFVRRVVEAHGGTIREKGKSGHGAEFEITLPIAQTSANDKGEHHGKSQVPHSDS